MQIICISEPRSICECVCVSFSVLYVKQVSLYVDWCKFSNSLRRCWEGKVEGRKNRGGRISRLIVRLMVGLSEGLREKIINSNF